MVFEQSILIWILTSHLQLLSYPSSDPRGYLIPILILAVLSRNTNVERTKQTIPITTPITTYVTTPVTTYIGNTTVMDLTTEIQATTPTPNCLTCELFNPGFQVCDLLGCDEDNGQCTTRNGGPPAPMVCGQLKDIDNCRFFGCDGFIGICMPPDREITCSDLIVTVCANNAFIQSCCIPDGDRCAPV